MVFLSLKKLRYSVENLFRFENNLSLYKPGIGIAIASIKRFQISTCTVNVLLIACLLNELIDYIEYCT